ncbi:MAG: acyltransferase [Chitinophagaceae bacterium]|jgi:putative colanic acid biosynthesis acetyltransferase WcaF|nr:acyltransferase [Chitinophagaceae bacterium]
MIFSFFRYDLPLFIVLRLTNWFPEYLTFIELRGYLCSFFIKSCGKRLRIQRNVSISSPNNLFIGDKVTIAYGCWISAGDKIELQNSCGLSPYVCLASGGFEYEEGKAPIAIQGPITVEEGVWIGANTTVILNSKICKNSIIAANSLVNRRIPPNSVYGGNPIKKISDRIIISEGKN